MPATTMGGELVSPIVKALRALTEAIEPVLKRREWLVREDPELAEALCSALDLLTIAMCKSMEPLEEAAEVVDRREAHWRTFLDEHGELEPEPQKIDGGRPVSDDELRAALRDEIRAAAPRHGAVAASGVAKRLYPEMSEFSLDDVRRRARVGRVAARLGKLYASGGGIVRLRARDCGGGSCYWSLPGVALTEDDLRWHEVGMANDAG